MSTCSIPFVIESFSDLLVWPTGCSYYFWLIILGSIFAVVAWGLFTKEEDKRGEGEIISGLGVTSIAITLIALFGTFIKNHQDLPMIQSDVFMLILAPTVVLVLIWMYKK